MNRAEYRRSQRYKNPTYTYTQDQIDEIKRRAAEEAMITATILMFGIPCLSCRDLFGFGRKRLERLMDKNLFWLKSVNDGEVGLDEILKVIEEETGYHVTQRGKITPISV